MIDSAAHVFEKVVSELRRAGLHPTCSDTFCTTSLDHTRRAWALAKRVVHDSPVHPKGGRTMVDPARLVAARPESTGSNGHSGGRSKASRVSESEHATRQAKSFSLGHWTAGVETPRSRPHHNVMLSSTRYQVFAPTPLLFRRSCR